MKLFDEKGRIFGLINYVDLLVILMIVLVGAKFLVVDKVQDDITIINNNQEIRFVYEVNGIRDISVGSVQIGDVFKDDKTKGVLGEVVAKEVNKAKMATTNSNGEVIYAEIPDRYVMRLTIKGSGVANDSEVKIGGTVLQIGKLITIDSKVNRFEGVVVGLDS